MLLVMLELELESPDLIQWNSIPLMAEPAMIKVLSSYVPRKGQAL